VARASGNLVLWLLPDKYNKDERIEQMITGQNSNTLETSGAAIDAAEYHIDPNNIVHVTQILRNMYANPQKAVVREYISNAIDAHVQQGIDRPIEIHVPTTDEPYYSVRDFGDGLDLEDTKSLLYGYGSSGAHKRASNEQIGGFGIGCKSAFSICDAFTYTVWHGGMKRVWSCFLDERDMGRANLVFEEASADEAGIEVKIPFTVSYNTESKIGGILQDVFQFLEHRPVVRNA